MDRRFFHRLGASQLDRTICSETGGQALISVYGRKLGTDPEVFPHAKLIIAWAANIHGNNIHLWPFVEEARRNGAKLVVIDPYATRTARAADWHIPINPGSDSALALGLMHIIVRDRLFRSGLRRPLDLRLRSAPRAIAEYPPDSVAALTGISVADIERLARDYATIAPAVIRLNYGVQRSDNGGAATRAIAMLPALTGAWKHYGGGLQLSTSGAFRWDKATIERPDLMQASPLGREARVVNMSVLGQALTELGSKQDDGPPVHVLFVYNSNPAAIAPDQYSVLRGLPAPTSSPSSTSSSSPIPPTTPTSSFPRPPSSSTRMFRALTATTTSSSLSRPSSPSAKLAPTSGSSPSLPSAWDSPSPVSSTPPTTSSLRLSAPATQTAASLVRRHHSGDPPRRRWRRAPALRRKP